MVEAMSRDCTSGQGTYEMADGSRATTGRTHSAGLCVQHAASGVRRDQPQCDGYRVQLGQCPTYCSLTNAFTSRVVAKKGRYTWYNTSPCLRSGFSQLLAAPRAVRSFGMRHSIIPCLDRSSWWAGRWCRSSNQAGSSCTFPLR